MKITANRWIYATLTATLVITSACGKKKGDGTSAASTLFSKIFPQGFALSSPTASRSASAIVLAADAATPTVKPTATFEEKKAALTSLLSGANEEACRVTLPTIQALSQRATCYGPTATYSNHPDGTPTSGSLPSGDLGLWEKTEGTTAEACASAQMNSLISSASSLIDTALSTTASMSCLLNVKGSALPGTGTSVDVTTEFNSSLGAKNAGSSVTSAKVEGIDGTTYKYTIVAKLPNGTFTLYLKHQSLADDNSSYQGRIWGTNSGNTDQTAFSMTYRRESSTIKARLLAGEYAKATAESSIFSTVGDINPVGTAGWSRNMNHALLNLNADTGMGHVSYAWQAGTGDSHTRVFNAYTARSGSSDTGCGFFGFGDAFVAASNTNTIKTFVCNWAGPGNSHTGLTGRAQKQCMARNAAGLFAPTDTGSKILYAPTNSCNDPNSGGFTYTKPTFAASTTVTANELVTLTSDTDFTNYSAPAAPTLTTGF